MRKMDVTSVRRILWICLFMTLPVSGCTAPCTEDVLQSSTSPDGVAVATLTVANCGATTHFVTAVHVRTAKDKGRKDEDVVFASEGRTPIHLSWVDHDTLAILCDSCDKYTKVHRIANKKANYRITYPWLAKNATE
jgi:hypothetical protein